MHKNGEQLLTEIFKVMADENIHIGSEVQEKLRIVMDTYHIKKVEMDTIHPDLIEKMKMFLSAKRLEGFSEVTLKGYQLELRIFTEHVKKRAEDVNTAELRNFLGGFTEIKSSSRARKLSVLKSFFGWLTAEEYLQRDPSAKIKPPKQEKRLPKALSIEELEMLRESCRTLRQRAMLEVLYATGCRLSEVQALNISDVDYQSMSCRVIGKGNKEREVYFSYKAMYHLKKYLESRTDHVGAILITERQPYRRLSNRAIQREIEKIAKQAGLEKRVSPHTMRHTFATLTLNNGADIVAVQHLLGHSDPATTMTYSNLSDERKREQHKKFLVQ